MVTSRCRLCLLFQGRVPFGGEEKDEKTVTGHERGLRGRGLCLVADLAGVPRRHPAGLLDAGVPELLVPVDELREATGCISNRMHKDLLVFFVPGL